MNKQGTTCWILQHHVSLEVHKLPVAIKSDRKQYSSHQLLLAVKSNRKEHPSHQRHLTSSSTGKVFPFLTNSSLPRIEPERIFLSPTPPRRQVEPERIFLSPSNRTKRTRSVFEDESF